MATHWPAPLWEKVLDLFEEDHIIEHVREVAPYLEQRLNELAEKYDCIQERRGVGLMQGLVFDHPVEISLTEHWRRD